MVVGLAPVHEPLRAAVLDGWQLLDWLEVRGLLLNLEKATDNYEHPTGCRLHCWMAGDVRLA
jgi:hypothetical protein